MCVVLYLHGFLSSPKSMKAQVTGRWLNRHRPNMQFVCPALPSLPRDIEPFLSRFLAQYQNQKIIAIGSSLGGLWATHFVDRGLIHKAVLVNPAVLPASRFKEFVGQALEHYYSREVVELTETDIQTLAECEPEIINNPEKYWVLLQTGDETLDYRLAEKKYDQCKCLIEQGGSHTFDGYENVLPKIIEFLED